MKAEAANSYEVGPNLSSGDGTSERARKEVVIEVNDILQVQFPNDPNSFSLRSRVDDIVGDRVYIAWPTDKGIRVPIHKQQTLTISFARDDAVYAFTGIVEHTWRRPLAQLSLLVIGPPQRIQRRQFFRVKCLLPVEFLGEQPSLDEDDSAPKIIALKTHTYEISGSGLAIRHSSSIPSGTMLDCKLSLAPENAKMKILCRVVHSSRINAHTQTGRYHVGMFFISIRDADRTRIVRHVFRVERSRNHPAPEPVAPVIGKMRVPRVNE